MKLLRQRDIPEEKYSNAFLGFGSEETNFAVELTYSEFLRLIIWSLFSYDALRSWFMIDLLVWSHVTLSVAELGS